MDFIAAKSYFINFKQHLLLGTACGTTQNVYCWALLTERLEM
jgi:hypothetical protein